MNWRIRGAGPEGLDLAGSDEKKSAFGTRKVVEPNGANRTSMAGIGEQ